MYKTDITKLAVDAIVNEFHSHGRDVAVAHSGRGPLTVTEVAVTTEGSLPCKKVLLAVGPRWSDYTDKAECRQRLVDTVYNCLLQADRLGFTTVALPSISSGVVSTRFRFSKWT